MATHVVAATPKTRISPSNQWAMARGDVEMTMVRPITTVAANGSEAEVATDNRTARDADVTAMMGRKAMRLSLDRVSVI